MKVGIAMASKAKYWTGVLYTENMLEDWETEIGDILQLPFAYCVHNMDKDRTDVIRKEHVHLILVFPNTTTYNHAFSIFNNLSAPNKSAINKIESVINIRYIYEYLIHNTDTCKKKGKYLYDVSNRVLGNNFDIGSYEQLSMTEKNDICKELCNVAYHECFTNFADFYYYVAIHFDDSNYFELLKTYSGLFDRIIRGNYHKVYGTDINQSIRQTQGCFNKNEEE